MKKMLVEEDSQLLQKNIASFLHKYVIPEEQKVMPSLEKLPEEVVMQLQKKTKEMGLWFLNGKNEWGGSELSIYDQVLLNIVASQHHRGLFDPGCGAFGSDLPSFLDHCTQEQIDKYVVPSIESGRGCYVAMWEKHEGSDLEQLEAHATRSNNGWLLNGEKKYVANIEQAYFGIVLVHVIKNGKKNQPYLLSITKILLKKKKTN
ncbi:acyl-CoA dehydrogenase family protein [Alkalihalobacterium alkalinitrilicum]|uniref:acyl-CoA dehydrogenase family protein n=1 Tax=Alkalihalobacterium alkalinitrilicum TaxID=427920 RepID=UPI0009950D36|nr:acyl-CoA dehydrogenase family protein [Alkalihalobacterium alkalinitrilicum]